MFPARLESTRRRLLRVGCYCRQALRVTERNLRLIPMSFATSPASVVNPWIRILSALEKKVIRQSFDTWFKPTRYSHVNGRTLYVRVPTLEFQHIGDKYADLIQEAVDLNALE